MEGEDKGCCEERRESRETKEKEEKEGNQER